MPEDLMLKTASAAAALLGACLVLAVTGVTHAATVFKQAPCDSEPDEFCVNFRATGPVPEVRRRTFEVPGPGTVVVMFHGALTCANLSSVKGGTQIESQIVTDPDAVPDPSGPGGLIHMGTLPPDGRLAFNLASTRVINVSAARRLQVIFKLRRVNLEPTQTECRAYNAVFTILFEPAVP
jgi:hypothetical protein